MKPSGRSWKGTANRLFDLRLEIERLRREHGPELHPPGKRPRGEFSLGLNRIYTFFPETQLRAVAEITEKAPWPDKVLAGSTVRQRLTFVRNLLDEATSQGWDAKRILTKLESRIVSIESSLAEYTFVFPLSNVELRTGVKITIGDATLQSMSDGLWPRFTNEVVTHVNSMIADGAFKDNDRGPLLANNLLGEETLRGTTWANGYCTPAIVVRASGLTTSAYRVARERALFFLAAMTSRNDPVSERFHTYVALDGEQLERGLARRFRFASGTTGPESLLDGISPGLPFQVDHEDSYYHLIDQAVRSKQPEADRVLRTIYWLGHTLNDPTFGEDEPDDLKLDATMTYRPTSLELGLRIRALVTAMEASFKRDKSDATDEVVARFLRALEHCRRETTEAERDHIREAIEARHTWTHAGKGSVDRQNAGHLARAIQAVLPKLLDQVANGRADSFDELHRNWTG